MGAGFGTALGGVAQGFAGAAAEDRQRQFLSEENRRQQIGGFLQNIAMDETAHPYSRQQAVQQLLQLHQTPYNKPYKFDPNVLVAPQGPQQPTQTATTPSSGAMTPPPPPPSGLAGGAAGPPSMQQQAGALPLTRPPVPQQQAQFTPPPSPGGLFMTPEQVTQMQAARIGAMTGAQAGAEAKQFIYQMDPVTHEMKAIPVSGTGQPIGQPINNAFNPMMFRGMASMMHPISIVGADGTPVPALQDKIGIRGVPGAVYDNDGNLIPHAQVWAPSLVPSTNTESMSASGAITRKHTPTPQAPSKGNGTISTPPAPSSGGGTSSQTRGGTSGTLKLPTTPEEYEAIKDPVTREAMDWAMLGQKPTGSTMAVRQVEARMNQLGLAKALPVSPALQRTIQQQFVARNSAIGLIDDITANKDLFTSLLTSGKIAIASSPDGSGVLQRLADLNPREAKVAGDFQQLIEHANLLRGPLGATGFRGTEAWNALQAQRGKPLGDPQITMQVLGGMRDRLVGLNTADKMVLTGQGMNAAAADPYEGHTATNPANGHQIKWTGGAWVDAKTGNPL